MKITKQLIKQREKEYLENMSESTKKEIELFKDLF